MATDLIETNAPELSARLQAMGARIEDPAPALERARALLARNEAAVWASQGSALGASWAPAVQAENKTDSRLLVATGRGRSALTGTSPAPRMIAKDRSILAAPIPRGFQMTTSPAIIFPSLSAPEISRQSATRDMTK